MVNFFKNKKREKGIALIIVLWLTITIALLVSSLNGLVRNSITIASSETTILQRSYLLESGVEIAANKLLDEDKKSRWIADGQNRSIKLSNSTMTIKIGDPNGLVDLNKSDKRLLLNFLSKYMQLQKAENLADAIVALRPKKRRKASNLLLDNTNNLKTLNDAWSFVPPFIDLTQFRRLPGVDNEIYKNLLPFITVHGRDGKINPVTAPLEVLSSIPGVSNLLAEDIISNRSSFFQGDSQYFTNLKAIAGTFINEKTTNVYIVTVKMKLQNKVQTVGRRYIIAINIDRNRPFNILGWHDI